MMIKNGAGDGFRTRDPKLGKLVLYQLSYARFSKVIITAGLWVVNTEKGLNHALQDCLDILFQVIV